MAFITNVDELQALLDTCSLTQELEFLIQSILIPDEWIPVVYARMAVGTHRPRDTSKYSAPS